MNGNMLHGHRSSQEREMSVGSTLSHKSQKSSHKAVVPDSTHPDAEQEDPEAVQKRWWEALTCCQKVFLLLEEPDSSRGARGISYIVLVTILASIVGFILQTEPALMTSVVLKVVELGSMVIFTVEYIGRLVVCSAFNDQTRCEFLKAPANIVDLLAILPTYLLDMDFVKQQIGSSSAVKPLRVLRAVRLVRIFRICKLSKYSSGMSIMVESMVNSTRPLVILMFILSIGITIFSSLVYYAEAAYCPVLGDLTAAAQDIYVAQCEASLNGFSKDGYLCCTFALPNGHGSPNDFESIIDAFWWSMVTMTTVGYGDKAPRTTLGRAVGFVTMISGIVLISLPVAIVGTKFQEAYEIMELQQSRDQCPSDVEDTSPETDSKKVSQLGPVFQTVKFLEQTKIMAEVHVQSDGGALKPVSVVAVKPLANTVDVATDGSIKPVCLKVPGQEGTADIDGKPKPKTASPAMDPSLRDAGVLRAKLKKLEGQRSLSRAAQGQVELMLELMDHLEAVDSRLGRLHEKDAALDVCIHRDFVALSRACSAQPSAPASS